MIEEISEVVFNNTTSLTLVSLRHNRLDETRMAPLAWINHRYNSHCHLPATLFIPPSPCNTYSSITLLHSSPLLPTPTLPIISTSFSFLESGWCVLTDFLSPGAWSPLICLITTSTWFPPTCRDPSFTWFWLGIT